MATKSLNKNETNLTCFFLEVFWRQSSHGTLSIISCVVSSLFALAAVLGNGTIMLVIWRSRQLNSTSFTLLFCLAFSDFLVGLLGQPFFVAFKTAELLGKFNAYCKLRLSQFFIGWITGGISFAILSGVSIDRLLALTLHLRYKTIVTNRRVFMLVISVCISISIVTISKFWMRDNWVIMPATIFSVTTLMTAVSTFQIFQIARMHQRQIFQQNQTLGRTDDGTVHVLKCKKSAVTVLYVYGLRLTFYLPFISVVMIETILGVTQSVTLAYDLATATVFINSSLNPLIYCWRMTHLRLAVKTFLKNLICVPV